MRFTSRETTDLYLSRQVVNKIWNRNIIRKIPNLNVSATLKKKKTLSRDRGTMNVINRIFSLFCWESHSPKVWLNVVKSKKIIKQIKTKKMAELWMSECEYFGCDATMRPALWNRITFDAAWIINYYILLISNDQSFQL